MLSLQTGSAKNETTEDKYNSTQVVVLIYIIHTMTKLNILIPESLLNGAHEEDTGNDIVDCYFARLATSGA